MIRQYIERVVAGIDLTAAETEGAMAAIMDGEATPSQVSAFLVGLRMKGETAEELLGAARAMRSRVEAVEAPSGPVLDTCGTGGDGAHTFNISTTAAIVAAACGVKVAKHGNRSVSSRCGSADVLEALGVNLNMPPANLSQALAEIGIAFLFAPNLHPAMRHAAGPRREIGIRTVFNLLGPLTNPAGATHQLVGVYDRNRVEQVAQTLGSLGARRALVVHGEPGLDEISICGPTFVAQWDETGLRTYTVTPEELGFQPAPVEALRGGDAAHNADLLRGVLRGEPGPLRDAVLVNAGAALVAAGAAGDVREGVALAAAAVDGGHAMATLEALVEFTQKHGERQAV